MRILSLFAIFLPLPCSSCAVVTTPVKIVGKTVTTTMEVSGKVIGSGVDAITPGSDNENESNE